MEFDDVINILVRKYFYLNIMSEVTKWMENVM